MGHFGDDLPSQSHDWYNKPVFLTNHVAGTSQIKSNYNQVTTQNYQPTQLLCSCKIFKMRQKFSKQNFKILFHSFFF